MHVHGYAALKEGGSMKPVQFDREPVRAGEVAIDISHCGVCHSDFHQVKNDWDNSVYPCVPGHEIVGRVTEVGEGVSRFKAGDRVGVGCMINSCRECDACRRGEEQYCSGPKGATMTYNGPIKPDGTNSYGGYSSAIIVREEFVLSIPEAISDAEAAPILCAGITTYQPMKHWGVKAGQRVGVAGIGGLGHMAIQIARALGAEVVALTTDAEKEPLAKELGASQTIAMDDDAALEGAKESLDFLISTIPYPHDFNPYVELMKADGKMVIVGNLIEFEDIQMSNVVMKRLVIAGSAIGGIGDTQEVLDFCARTGVRPRIELIAMEDIDEAFDRAKDEEVHFRSVIDMATLQKDADAKEIDTPVRGEVVNRATQPKATEPADVLVEA
ncbi:NAD(P)-dependent alcohol dehydrogenase [Sphingomonas ginkgonis]|uniref:NAD(P)-dependent alcohol dehydrogenase n=1 Tax=Sphingomonas ginkgonis TaxID=2315330 RepID=UPI001EF0EDAF|nr:NAD(P)-dependent alcohol dehydrogenase [Sphingomonas ginkgonis]